MHAVDVKIKARIAADDSCSVARLDAMPALIVFVEYFLAVFMFAWWLGAPKAA